ncbi:APC family permease [Caulobacter sp. S45]|uniref:APC family permease n=1 Tax=Caulobacter sp. S45 TaxID=1641861 RepID=UPI0015760486|nr:APC family permease [Caulobacter sp. S45]
MALFAPDKPRTRGEGLQPGSSSLLRVLGLGFGVAVVVGGVVGQGILRTPGIVAAGLEHPGLILLAWVVAGLLTMVDACSIAELGAADPRTGGPFAYVRLAFGRAAGFLAGWIDWLAQTATAAFIAVVFGECLHRLGLLRDVGDGVVAAGLLAALTAFHLLGTLIGGWSQNVGSALKALALLALVAVFFAARAQNGGHAVAAGPIGAAAVITALRAIYATYGSWNAPAYFGEEVQDPGRNLPRALLMGLALVMVIYTLVNAALLHVLGPAGMAKSSLPVADAAQLAIGANGAWLVTLAALFIVLTVENTQLMFTPRVLYSMAKDKLLPARLTGTLASGVPAASLVLTALVAVALASSGAYERLLAIYAPLSTLTNALVNLAAIRMRLADPQRPRPFRMPLFPVPAIVALLVNGSLTVFFVAQDFASARYAVLLVLSGIPLLLWASRKASGKSGGPDAALTSR